MIALQGNEPAGSLRKSRHLAEFALRHPGVEIIAAQHVFKIFYAIDFMHALFRADEQAHVIPLAHRLGRVQDLARRGIHRRLIELIQPAAADVIGRLHIVFQLKLRSRLPHRVALIRHVIHDAAVAAFGNVVIQLQFKPAELVGGDDIARVMRIRTDQLAILHLPAWAHAVFLEIMPAGKTLAVEEELPARRLFRLGQRVIGGWRGAGPGRAARKQAGCGQPEDGK